MVMSAMCHSGHQQRLFDHLVGAPKQWLRNCKVECLGKLEIDGQLDLCHLLNRQVSSLFAFENATGANSKFVEFVRPACPVGHETSREEILAVRIYGWQHVPSRQPDHAITLGQKERFTADHKCADPFADEAREGRLNLVGSACGVIGCLEHKGYCPIERVVRNATEAFLAVLDALTLADLIKPQRVLSSLLLDRRVSLRHT